MEAHEMLTYNLAIDFAELKSAKKELLEVLILRGILDDGNDSLNSLLSLLDEIGDQATDVHGLSPNLVFDLKNEIC